MRSLALLLLVATGCVPARRVVTIERDVYESATVPPPSGPVATGPLAEPGGASLDLEVAGAYAVEATETREAGALGNITPRLAGRLRLSGRLADVVEGGLAIEVLPGQPAVPAATDVGAGDGEVSLLVRGGPQLRIAAPVSDAVSIDFQGDLRISRLKVERNIRVHEMEWEASPGGWVYSEAYEFDDESWTPVMVHGRLGMGVGVRASDRVHVDGGFFVQDPPRVPGFQSDRWTCVYEYGEPDHPCDGPEMPPIVKRTVVGTTWLGLGLRLGRAWLLPAAWWHVLPDEHGLATASPVGGALALRIPLGKPQEPEPDAAEVHAPPPAP